jgi:hypothetical protein
VAGEDLKTKVEIGGDTAGLATALSDAAAKVKNGASQITESFGQVGEIFESVTGKLVAFSAGLGAAAGFAEIIHATTELSTSIRSLSLSMGISVENASVLKSALTTIGATSEGYVGALDHLARQMKTNEDGINALGIATRNTDGTTRDSQAVMLDALKAVQQYKPGLDQTQAAMYLFGRSVQEVRQLMPLLNVNMDEAKTKAQALGLVLSDEQVAAVNQYKVALNESKEVVEGAFSAIGQKLIPILTESAKAFADLGPQIVKIASVVGDVLVEGFRIAGEIIGWVTDTAKTFYAFWADALGQLSSILGVSGAQTAGWGETWRNALGILAAVADFIRGTLIVALEFVVGEVKNVAIVFSTLGTVAADLAHHLDFKQAWADLKSGFASIKEESAKTFASMTATAAKTGQDIGKALLSGYQSTAPKPGDIADPFAFKSGNKGFEAPDKSKDAAAGRDAVLRAQLAGENAIVKEYVSEQDKELQDSYHNGLIALKDYYAQRLALSQLQLDTEIATTERMQQSVAAQKAAAAATGDNKGVLSALAQEATLQSQLIVLQQKRAAVAQQSAEAQADAERKLANEIALAHATANEKIRTDALDAQHAVIAAEAAAGQISGAAAIEAFRNIERQKYDIAVEFATQRAALDQNQVKAQAELGDKLAAIRADYEKKDTEIAVQNIKQRKDFETQAITDIQNGFATMLDEVETKHKTVFDAIKSMLTNLEAQFLKMANQELAQNLFGANPTAGSAGGAGGGGLLASLFGAAGSSGGSSFWSSIFGSAGAGASAGGGFVPGFQEGTSYVPRTGLAVLHAGERVLTRQENMEGGNQSVVHVHNNFNVQGETSYESRAAIASSVGRSLRAAQRNL